MSAIIFGNIEFGSGSSSITLSTTGITDNRTITFSDTVDTLIGRDTTDTLTNKTLIDSSTIIADLSDNTIQIIFDASETVLIEASGGDTINGAASKILSVSSMATIFAATMTNWIASSSLLM